MMTLRASLIALLLLSQPVYAWDIRTERSDQGDRFVVAEQAGDGGASLHLVCFDKDIHIEILYPAALPEQDDVTEILQIDGRPERLLAGSIERVDNRTSVFVGIDRRDKPAAATADLLREMQAGQSLYLGDPDMREAVERWSLKGSSKAISTLKSSCK